MAQTLLELERLTVEYRTGKGLVRAVDGVDLTIAPGQVLGLAGESGSGKSTLALAIVRLLPARVARVTGGVRFRGQDVLAMDPETLRRFRWRSVSIVFQSAMNALNPVLTVRAQILDALAAHPGAWKGDRAQRARELVDIVEIGASGLGRYPHELSGGMRQRAVIAIALALEPDLVIMDEPTTALDVVVQQDLLAKVGELRRRYGFSILFITHDLSLLLDIADTIGIMYAGRMVEMGPAAELVLGQRHPYTQGLVHSFPGLTGPRVRMSGIAGSAPDLLELAPGCRFHPRCPNAMERCRVEDPRWWGEGDRGAACHLLERAGR